MVRFSNPSQSNPSNHLKKHRKVMVKYTHVHYMYMYQCLPVALYVFETTPQVSQTFRWIVPTKEQIIIGRYGVGIVSTPNCTSS